MRDRLKMRSEEEGFGDRCDVCVVGEGRVKYPLSEFYKGRNKEIKVVHLCCAY